MTENRGIEYRPDINYDLEDAPGAPVRTKGNENVLIKPKHYTGPHIAEQKNQETMAHLDFLIETSEKKLKDKEGFEDFKEACIKKYYCHQPLSEDEAVSIQSFEEEVVSLNTDKDEQTNGSIVPELYETLLVIKKDLEVDQQQIDRIKQDQIDIFKKYQHIFASYAESPQMVNVNFFDGLDKSDERHEHMRRLDALNKSVTAFNDNIALLESQKQEAIDEGLTTVAKSKRKQIQRQEALLSEALNNVSFLASESYALNKKAEDTDGFLKRAGYLLLASPLDKLDEGVCCFLKVFLKQMGWEGKIEDGTNQINQAKRKMHVNQLTERLDALRGVLFLAHTNETELITNLNDMLDNLMMSPVRTVLSNVLNSLRSLQSEIVIPSQQFLGSVLETDFENPDSVLDCISFEKFADFIFDEIEGIFDDIEDRVIDLFKLFQSRRGLLDDELLSLGKKDKIKQTYDMLTKLSNYINTFEEFRFNAPIEEIIEEFLVQSGFGETYNSQTGKFERLDLQGCFMPTSDRHSYKNNFAENPNEMKEINFEEDKSFKDYMKNYDDPIRLDCHTEDEDFIEMINQNEKTLDQKINDYKSLNLDYQSLEMEVGESD